MSSGNAFIVSEMDNRDNEMDKAAVVYEPFWTIFQISFFIEPSFYDKFRSTCSVKQENQKFTWVFYMSN